MFEAPTILRVVKLFDSCIGVQFKFFHIFVGKLFDFILNGWYIQSSIDDFIPVEFVCFTGVYELQYSNLISNNDIFLRYLFPILVNLNNVIVSVLLKINYCPYSKYDYSSHTNSIPPFNTMHNNTSISKDISGSGVYSFTYKK